MANKENMLNDITQVDHLDIQEMPFPVPTEDKAIDLPKKHLAAVEKGFKQELEAVRRQSLESELECQECDSARTVESVASVDSPFCLKQRDVYSDRDIVVNLVCPIVMLLDNSDNSLIMNSGDGNPIPLQRSWNSAFTFALKKL